MEREGESVVGGERGKKKAEAIRKEADRKGAWFSEENRQGVA
jgi:hypothetical protein